MKIWCAVECRLSKEAMAEKRYAVDVFFIQIEIPAILPVGSMVHLPAPKLWLDTIMCEIKGYAAIGTYLECQCEPVGTYFSDESFSQMAAIGYTRVMPKEYEEQSDLLGR
jgi:hypothetical protein